MAKRTMTLGLIKPDLDDDADIRVVNANFDVIDQNHVFSFDSEGNIIIKGVPYALNASEEV